VVTRTFWPRGPTLGRAPFRPSASPTPVRRGRTRNPGSRTSRKSPHKRWQTDENHWRLRDGNEVEITAEQAAALEKLPESFGVVVEVRKSTKRASGGD
jgi:hypothetical protein